MVNGPKDLHNLSGRRDWTPKQALELSPHISCSCGLLTSWKAAHPALGLIKAQANCQWKTLAKTKDPLHELLQLGLSGNRQRSA